MTPPVPVAAKQVLRVQVATRRLNPDGFALDAAFEAAAGFTILFGASGAGKTTILDYIAGLRTPSQGQIVVGENVLFDSASGMNLPPNRRSVGYLMQSLALFPHMTVLQNVAYGLGQLAAADRAARASEILESFRIAGLSRSKPEAISAGERQRVALARTLVTRPRVLLLDEPLAALDAVTKRRILDDLRTWNAQRQIPIVYVTHDRGEVFALGETVLVLENGRMVGHGTPHEALGRPLLESVAQLAGFENILQGRISGLHPEQGTMTCQIAESVNLEVPLTRADVQQGISIGVRAGDILVASQAPTGLSARNVLRGTIRSLEQRDVTVIANVDCGVNLVVHLTPGAQHALNLARGSTVWLVIKTYSCHVLQ